MTGGGQSAAQASDFRSGAEMRNSATCDEQGRDRHWGKLKVQTSGARTKGEKMRKDDDETRAGVRHACDEQSIARQLGS